MRRTFRRFFGFTTLLMLTAGHVMAQNNILSLGKLTTQPETERASHWALADGVPTKGHVFPVGSSGGGIFTLTFPRSRETTGLRFYQNGAVYYCTTYEVRADRDGDGTFELVLADSKANDPHRWTEVSWKPTTLRALQLRAMEGVAKGKRAYPCVGELEVFGSEMKTDAEDAKACGWPVTDIHHCRQRRSQIDLSGKTRPVIILCPENAAGGQAAKTVSQTLQAHGATNVSVTSEPKEALPDTTNVVALGNVNCNELIARLYWNRCAYEDALVPGPAGWSLRTVCDPYPWHNRGNVVIVGYSRDADAEQAAQQFAQHLAKAEQPLVLPSTVLISTAPRVSTATRAIFDKLTAPSFKIFADFAERYLRTGRIVYAEYAVATLDRIVKAQNDNPTYDCDWPEETSSGRILAIWDAFEETPHIKNECYSAYTRAVFRFMQTLPKHVSGYAGIGTKDSVTWNHTTFPLLGLYFGSRYFADYYELASSAEHLRKAKACFLAQAPSWKPQEDADSYMVLTVNHTIDYCLGEWQWDLLRQTELIPRLADYVIGFCDSAGLAAGFGDSGIHASPSLIPQVVPRALWWTRDPSYLWILRHSQGQAWANPFHPELEPVEPKDHIGVRVFPLTQQLYDYTTTHRFYNEPLTPPNVPWKNTFDKVSLRESWDKKAQYILLDGFSRGKHLHYDGNAIIEYVDVGRPWLIDHDYLTRNTTEHNMLSVLRNARANTLEPPCARLRAWADSGGLTGFVSTQVHDYMGVDWQRDLFWLKGEHLVVLDRVTAVEADSFDLDLVWKVIHRGDEHLDLSADGGALSVRRCDAGGHTRGASVIEDPTASGGKAVVLGQSGAVLSFAVSLPAGKYRVELYAYGEDGSSDSVYLSVGGSAPIACHLPKKTYGPSNERFDLSGSPVLVPVRNSGRQAISISLRERPPVHLDRIRFLNPDGSEHAVFEVEQAPRPTEAELAALPADHFFIKWPDATVSARTAVSSPKGIVVPVLKLFQRRSAKLGKGKTVEFANILFARGTGEAQDYGIRRVGSRAVLVTGSETALLASRGASVSGLRFNGQMLAVSARQIAWCGGSEISFGSCRISATATCSAEIEVATGRVLGGQGVTVEGVSAEAVTKWLNECLAHAQSTTAPATPDLPATTPKWTIDFGEGDTKRLRLADLNGDGTQALIAAAGNSIIVLDTSGQEVWRFRGTSPFTDVDVGDLSDRPGLEVLAGNNDPFLRIFAADGTLVSQHELRGPSWNQKHGDRPWGCSSLRIVDLDTDGINEIAVGTNSMELRLFTPNWQQQALVRKSMLHGSLDFMALDCAGDEKLELLAANRYGSVSIHRHDGTKLGSFYTSIGDMQAAVADLDGDGQIELIAGSSTGDLICWTLNRAPPMNQSKIRWRFDNFGYGVNRLRTADVDADGKPEILIASQTGYLYAVNGDGSIAWQRRVGNDIVELLVDAETRLICLDRDGLVTVLSPAGEVMAKLSLEMKPLRALVHGQRLIVGGTGTIAAYPLPNTK